MDINLEILNRIAEALERISPNIDKKIEKTLNQLRKSVEFQFNF